MIEALREIDISESAYAQQMALVRLQLYVTGETHRMLGEFFDNLRIEIDRAAGDGRAAGEDGNLTPMSAFALEQAARDGWRAFIGEWVTLTQAARRQATWIPFGQLARQHMYYFGTLYDDLAGGLAERRWQQQAAAVQNLHEDGPPSIGLGYPDEPGIIDQVRPFVFERAAFILRAIQARVDGILNDAEAIKYSDGKKFSDRIWSLENGGLLGILNVLGQAAAEGRSAWDTARDLEAYLGFGADCPRWTRDRLFKLTKTDIALGDEMGLIRNPCDSRGVAYNALKLARNEIQIVHHIATDQAFANVPWIEQEQIILSPAHPPIGCECEDVVAGGENGDGVYPKGEIVLPIHVQCLCFKVAVLMPADDFTARLRGWMTGAETWPAMDEYAAYLGFSMDDLTLWGAGGTATPAGALGVAWSSAPLAAWLLRWMDGADKDLAAALAVATPNEIKWALEQLKLPGLESI